MHVLWEQANGPLTQENVFDYFATSMFYDKQSNNQVLRMQTIYTGMPISNEAEELRWVGTSMNSQVSADSDIRIDDLLESNSPSSMHNLPPCSLFKSESDYPLTKVCVFVPCTSFITYSSMTCSKASCCLFHHEQPYISVSRRLHRTFESIGELPCMFSLSPHTKHPLSANISVITTIVIGPSPNPPA